MIGGGRGWTEERRSKTICEFRRRNPGTPSTFDHTPFPGRLIGLVDFLNNRLHA